MALPLFQWQGAPPISGKCVESMLDEPGRYLWRAVLLLKNRLGSDEQCELPAVSGSK